MGAVLDRTNEETQELNTELTLYTSEESRDDVNGSAAPINKAWYMLRWVVCCGQLLAISQEMFWACSFGSAQALGGFVPPCELNCLRFLVLLACITPIVSLKRLPVLPRRSDVVYLSLFCLTHNASNLFLYEASIYLPVGVLSGLETSLVVLVTAFITSILQKRLRPETLPPVMLCFVGVLVLAQPSFIFRYFMSTTTISSRPVCTHPVGIESNDTFNTSLNYDYSHNTSHPIVIHDNVKGYLFLVAGALSYITCFHILKYKLQEMNMCANLFWLGLSGVITYGVPMGAIETLTFPKSPLCIALLVAHSFCAMLCNVCMVISLSIISTHTYSIVTSLMPVFLVIAQYTILSNVNPGHRNALEIAGAILVCIGCVWEPVSTLYADWKCKHVNEITGVNAVGD